MEESIIMNFRRNLTQNVFLISLIGSLCVYYAYQYFRIESLMDDIDQQFEDAVYAREDTDNNFEPKPLASPGDRHLLYQPNEEIEFPTIKSGNPKIPHIVHQVYKNFTIPFGFVNNLRSFHSQNPKWQFRFWTFESGRELIKKSHPYLLKYYDNWGDNAKDDEKKFNMIRHVALYEYGGITADLDVYNRRSLDIATKKYGCIIPTEPFEHCALIYNFDVILSASVMLCRPKHPFFKLVLQKMENMKMTDDAFNADGGAHLTRVYMDYNNLTLADLRKKKTDSSSNSPFFYKGERAEDDDDAVYIPNTQYFMGTINHLLLNKKGNLKACSERDALQAYLTKRACAEFESRQSLREKRKYLFTARLWVEVWTEHYTRKKVHINKIIPNVIFYN